MPNIIGPRASRGRILASVALSKLVYGSPVWEESLDRKKYRQMYESTHRQRAIRVCSVYRAASQMAVGVVASLASITMMARERSRTYKEGLENAKRIKEDTVEEWQREWEKSDGTAVWTKKLIPHVRPWIKRSHGESNYYLSQPLLGRGCFMAYLHKFKLKASSRCMYCECGLDDCEHTFFVCPRWTAYRWRAEADTGLKLRPENVVQTMLESNTNWKAINIMAMGIIRTKETEERTQQLPTRENLEE